MKRTTAAYGLALATLAILEEFSDGELLRSDDDWTKEVTVTAKDARRIVDAFTRLNKSPGSIRHELRRAIEFSDKADGRAFKIVDGIRYDAEWQIEKFEGKKTRRKSR